MINLLGFRVSLVLGFRVGHPKYSNFVDLAIIITTTCISLFVIASLVNSIVRALICLLCINIIITTTCINICLFEIKIGMSVGLGFVFGTNEGL